jgi:pimeloyl-ACP methyl ester carboxylesterase
VKLTSAPRLTASGRDGPHTLGACPLHYPAPWARAGGGRAKEAEAHERARNWDLDAAIGKICANTFPFPVVQLQADSDPAQPPSIFADVATRCPNVRLEWVTNAGHFDNFDQPAQVTDAINRFVRAAERSSNSR